MAVDGRMSAEAKADDNQGEASVESMDYFSGHKEQRKQVSHGSTQSAATIATHNRGATRKLAASAWFAHRLPKALQVHHR
eukprot:CAMPEP_0170418638 /NCGR_PEP_ID=MMETSP0117_2-20130122/34367_1 /TAXON_ID=400756 /ORGANISM="Durinskia baltica, Strain CSIRO CS-38" /LENGTH=79 /DNA_ID=CAMNT_0010676925 /DNA_START=53 /DNA_END=292 /DNA_ORIENTATION=+